MESLRSLCPAVISMTWRSTRYVYINSLTQDESESKDLNIHITAQEQELTVNLSGGLCRLERADWTRLRHPQHDAKLELCKYTNCQTSAFRCGLTRLCGTQFVSNRLGRSASWTLVMGKHKAPRLSHFKQFKCLYCHSAVMSDLKVNSDTFWF